MSTAIIDRNAYASLAGEDPIDRWQKRLAFALSLFAMLNIAGTWLWAGFFRAQVRAEATDIVEKKTINVNVRMEGLEQHLVDIDKHTRILVRMAEEEKPKTMKRIREQEERLPSLQRTPIIIVPQPPSKGY